MSGATTILPYFVCENEFGTEKREMKWHFTGCTLLGITEQQKNALVTVLLPSHRKLTRHTLPAGRNNLQSWLKLKSKKTSRVKYVPCHSTGKPRGTSGWEAFYRADSLIQNMQKCSKSLCDFKLRASDIFNTFLQTGDSYHKYHYCFLEVI